MIVGDLVCSTTNTTLAFYGIVLELGHRYWNGRCWTVAHARVEWPNCKVSWEPTDYLEILVNKGIL